MSFSGMYVGATGLTSLGEQMNVIGNNLSNIDTIGYRGSSILFQDLISRNAVDGGVLSGGQGMTSQIGLGVGIADIRTIFRAGSYETGSDNMDMAINGKGMFRVASPVDGTPYYTRAGNFRFNNGGYLVDPSGNILQGRPVDPLTGTLGSSSDVQLQWETETINGIPTRVIRSNPVPTSALTFDFNLDNDAADSTVNGANPFFALGQAWDGTNEPPLPTSSYAYADNIKVYDAQGNSYDLTVYLDKVTVSNASGNTYWEYAVGGDPSVDGRSGLAGTSGAGLLMMGTLTFNHEGQLVGQSAYTFGGAGADFRVLSNWTPAAFDADGFPSFTAAFSSGAAAGGTEQTMSLNLGIKSTSGAWTNLGSNASAASVGRSQGALPNMADIWHDVFSTSTDYNASMATLNKTQDGYAAGYLVSVSVTEEGFLRGLFSNNQTQDFYQIPLYTFRNEFGLRREGSNLFSSTLASGEAIEGLPDTGNLGNIQGKTIETSNVDMAEQFVDMITTQRGYEANTKVITTADSLLNTAMSMKR